MLTLKIERSFAKCADDWERLYALTPEASPFLHPVAMKIAVRYFYPYYITRRCSPVFCVFSDGEKVRAIAPMLRYKSGRMQLFGDVNGFNESGMVYDSACVLPECVEILRQKFKDIEFVKIDERSPLSRFITAEAQKTNNVAISFPKDFDSYFASLSKSVRQNVRTAYNRLKTDGCVLNLELYTGGSKLPINQVIDLYCNRHNDRYGVKTGWLKKWFLKTQSFATRYYRYSPNALTFMLYIDGNPAAFMSGLVAENRMVVPRLSIDNSFKRYSPGVLLVVEVIKYLQRNTDISVLDLSQGEESYKYQLGGEMHPSFKFNL